MLGCEICRLFDVYFIVVVHRDHFWHFSSEGGSGSGGEELQSCFGE